MVDILNINFKPLTFCCVFFCFIDTGFRKCDRYKRVQSANIGVKCVTFVSETFTRYDSNITNVRQEIFTPMTWHSLTSLLFHEKLWKSVNIYKSYDKKSVAPFLCGHSVVFNDITVKILKYDMDIEVPGTCICNLLSTRWHIITGPPSFRRRNLVNIRFI